MTTHTQTRVMLVDDHSIMRDLLRDALENTGEFLVVAQAAVREADGKEVDSATDLESAGPPHPLARVPVGGCWNH